MTLDTDLYIFKRIQQSDESAFEILFKKYYKPLYNYARYYLDDVDVCHDIVQDVFGNIWELRNNLMINGSVKSYLFVSTRNTCLNHLKKQSVKRRVILNLLENSSGFHDGHEIIFGHEMAEKLDAVMEMLPGQCREIFTLSRFKGMKHKEIAQHLKISPKTVETQIYRALKIFKKNLNL